MKFTININQKALADTKLTLSDAAILDWLFVFCNAKSEQIAKNRIEDWTWISYANLMNDMPLLRIRSKGSLTKRFQMLTDEGYIETQLINERTYVRMTAKTDTVHFHTVQNNERSDKTVQKSEQLPETVQNNERNRSKKETDTVQNNERTSILTNQDTKTSKDGAKAPTPKEYAEYFFSEVKKLVNGEESAEMQALLRELHERNGIQKAVFWGEIKEFCAYWNELNPTGRKRLWEMQKTFEVGRRLTTWFNRAKFKNFNGSIYQKPKGKTVLA